SKKSSTTLQHPSTPTPIGRARRANNPWASGKNPRLPATSDRVTENARPSQEGLRRPRRGCSDTGWETTGWDRPRGQSVPLVGDDQSVATGKLTFANADGMPMKPDSVSALRPR